MGSNALHEILTDVNLVVFLKIADSLLVYRKAIEQSIFRFNYLIAHKTVKLNGIFVLNM